MAQNEKQKSLRLEEIELYPSDKYFHMLKSNLVSASFQRGI